MTLKILHRRWGQTTAKRPGGPLRQKCSQYCLEFHDQLREALSGTTSEKRDVLSRVEGREFLKCSGGFNCLEA